ncbi:MAG: mechanosensitive ion channel family protein [Tannerellaceae bacterium]
MNKWIFTFLLCVGLVSGAQSAAAQIGEKAAELLSTTFHQEEPAVLLTDTALLAEKQRMDSIRMQEMALQIQEMKLGEIVLRTELDAARGLTTAADSARRVEQRQRVDSLRRVTPGVPVVVDKDTLFLLYAKRGGLSPVDRAVTFSQRILAAGKSTRIKRDSVYLFDSEHVTDIMAGQKVLVTFTDQDALWQNTTRQELAAQYLPIIAQKVQELREEHSLWQVAKRAAYFVIVLLAQYALFRLTNYLFKKLRRKIVWLRQNRLHPITIRDYEFLDTRRQGRVLFFFSNMLRYLVLLVQLTISVPILFAIFPQTEDLAMKIFSYILSPMKSILLSMAGYLPNLFTILVIYYGIKYVIKGIQYIAGEIESEKLKLTGFYPDWAQPTFNIIRFLLYAFMIAMVYPYLPGSDSGVFQGISVFVGLIISLGSSTVIGNIIAGLVITYMRPFKLGDRIKLNDTTGNVIEKTPFVTRLRTPKNEVVTIPNAFIMSSHTVNYSASARQYGLIIHSTVTIGYDAPWRQVHQLLISAARATPGVMETPEPFVLETELSDFYPCYQINAVIRDADQLAAIYSDLHQNIQDKFNEAGVEIMSPHYRAERNGDATTIPAQYLNDVVVPPLK